jgi:uncharacterized damage-inducible protein DinB
MSVETIRGLYDYHRWANRRLFDVAAALGEGLASREVGTQFSFPTVKRMFGHLYGADWVWLSRWKGVSPTKLPGSEFPTLASIRAPWDDLEREQEAFVEALRPADLDRWSSTGTRTVPSPSGSRSGPCSSTCRTTPPTTGARSRR